MNINKKKSIIVVFIIAIIVSSFYLFVLVFGSNDASNSECPNFKKESIEETVEESIEKPSTEIEKPNNSDSGLSDEVVFDLKNNIGNGTNGGVTNVEKKVNEKGEDQYVFTYTDGSFDTITIVDKEDGSTVEDIGSLPQEDEELTKEETTSQEEVEEEIEQPQEEFDTVYERYLHMSKYDQYLFYKTFDSLSDYVEWYKAAQAEYNALHPTIEVGKDQAINFE